MYQTVLANSKQRHYDRQRILQVKKGDALIYWAKTGMRRFTMREAVNDYLEVSGANRSSIGGEEAILAHRKIAANRLAIDCIYALSKEELSKVDRELEDIVENVPKSTDA
jgi:hypothetical protein